MIMAGLSKCLLSLYLVYSGPTKERTCVVGIEVDRLYSHSIYSTYLPVVCTSHSPEQARMGMIGLGGGVQVNSFADANRVMLTSGAKTVLTRGFFFDANYNLEASQHMKVINCDFEI
jgi:hypothetical protein